MTRTKINWIYWALLALALVFLATRLGPNLVQYGTYITSAIRYPYSLDYGEGPLLDQTLRMASFENIYHADLTQPPFTIANYPPMYPLLQVPFAWIFGAAFWYGRLINLLAVLLTALFIALTLRALTHDWVGAVIGGLLLIAWPYINHWSLFNRIDELALVFSWAALFVTVCYYGRISAAQPPKWGLWVASVLFVLSIYTRQTYALAAPLAAFVWLIFGTLGTWKERIVRAVMLGVVVGGITGVLFVIINIATRGGFFLNIITANVNPFFWKTVENYANDIRDRYYVLLFIAGAYFIAEAVLGVIALVRWINRRRERRAAIEVTSPPNYEWRRSSWALVVPYLIAATAGSITIGKDGSNVNYLLEFCAAFALAAGAALGWAYQWKNWVVRIAIQVFLIGIIAFQCNIMLRYSKEANSYLVNRMNATHTIARVVEAIRDAQGPVIADEYMGLVPLAGKQLYFQPFEFKMMAQGGVWDEAPFLADIAAQKFDLLVMYEPTSWDAIGARYTPAQRDMIHLYYTLDKTIGEVYLYKPKK